MDQMKLVRCILKYVERLIILKFHFEAKINFAMRTSDIGFSKVGKYFPIIKSKKKTLIIITG